MRRTEAGNQDLNSELEKKIESQHICCRRQKTKAHEKSDKTFTSVVNPPPPKNRHKAEIFFEIARGLGGDLILQNKSPPPLLSFSRGDPIQQR